MKNFLRVQISHLLHLEFYTAARVLLALCKQEMCGSGSDVEKSDFEQSRWKHPSALSPHVLSGWKWLLLQESTPGSLVPHHPESPSSHPRLLQQERSGYPRYFFSPAPLEQPEATSQICLFGWAKSYSEAASYGLSGALYYNMKFF